MNKNTKKYMAFAIAILIILILIVFFLKNNRVELGNDLVVRISIDGDEHVVLPLDENSEYSLENGENENTIKIQDESVSMIFANCPDGECINQGEVNADNLELRALGNAIVCLPNRVVIEIVDK